MRASGLTGALAVEASMYMLRAKVCPFRSRDPGTEEMKDVTPRAWVEFDVLPAGIPPEGDGEVSVKVIECDADLDSAMAENERMGDEDEAIKERRDARRAKAADDAERLKAEKAAAVAAKHPAGWKPADPDRDRLIALGWSPPADDDAPPHETGERVPPDQEDPRLLDAEGNALSLEDFVEKHDKAKKDEIVAWAEGLGIVAEGTKAEILGAIFASVPVG